ncbi:toll/interleukin-1 receptor domain-containing protein [Streptomyces sp. NPDC059788]|uniref:toll/interleukin-1 receptor domain-containing protein n=1 Tax=Streptomyces sp. NPDC059788 TaxID=3346948 RepID=UPI00364A11DF
MKGHMDPSEPQKESVSPARDFFISYTSSDRSWAEWVAWQLEEAGYTTILQAWDFEAGSHFVTEIHRATQVAERTIVILSNAYVNSPYGEAEWQEAWRADPLGVKRKLLVFRIEPCVRPGLLGQLVSEDIFDIIEEAARSRLLAAARQGRRKPALPPDFPLQEAPVNAAPFPGRLVPAPDDEAMAAGGPLTPENPFAVALAFWCMALENDYASLHTVITPESQGWWDLGEIRSKSESGGISTGVMKPCYDIAYVRMLSQVEGEGEALVVAGGLVPGEARILSLVLRPELGGWRVHNFGFPQDPNVMPRTWIAE